MTKMMTIITKFLFFFTLLLRHTVHVTATTTTSPPPTSPNNSDDALRLYADVIDSFDKRIRPVLNQSRAIDVLMTFNIVNLVEVDEVNQRIMVNVWVNFSWWDEIRTWNPQDYGGINIAHPNPSDIWRPKTVITNSAGARDVFKDISTPFSVYSTGASRWYVGGMYYFVCLMDLTYFPFDRQTCTASVMSTSLGNEIKVIPVNETLLTDNYIENGEWGLISSGLSASPYPTDKDESLVFIFVSVTFQRRPMYYLVNFLVPIMCLSFLSLFGFVVPKDSGERASFAITVLLSLAVYMGTISDRLPANSDTFPLLSSYIFALLCLSMFSVLIIVCQMRMTGCEACKNDEDNDDNNSNNKDDGDSGSGNGAGNVKKTFHGENQITDGISGRNRVSPQFDSLREVNGGKTRSNHTNGTARNNSNNKDNNKDNNNTRDFWIRTPSVQGSASSSTATSSSTWKRFKCLVVKYDDVILFVIFAFLWLLITLAFVSKIVG